MTRPYPRMPKKSKNRTPTGRLHRPTGRFVTGNSANPGGRQGGIVAQVKAAVGPNAEKLVEGFALYAFGSDADIKARYGTKYGPRHEARIDCLKELRNMGFGVPRQALEDDERIPRQFTLTIDRPPL